MDKAFYNHQQIEKKWADRWDKDKLYEVDPTHPGEKFYCLDMFPYPSGSGLHVGHWRGYVLSDYYARYQRLKGKNVLHPMGYDSFGLPAERAAIKYKSHPKKYTEEAIQNFKRQLHEMASSFDWSKELSTCDPAYYKWTQWLFAQLFKHGLAEKRVSLVNWCPTDQTVLANEQVVNGCCERCGSAVTKKELAQWFLKTTEFAQDLLEGLDDVQWPERVKSLQRDWIGRSDGALVSFEAPQKPMHYVLLHGFTGTPETNFFPWLKKELELRGNTVEVPALPDTDDPTPMDQVEFVLKNCQLDANTVILGHSLGAAVALKVAEKSPVKRLVLVAGFLEPIFEDHDRPFAKKFDWRFDFEKIKDNTESISIVRASNDTAVGPKHAQALVEKLGGQFYETIAEDDHFCGTKEPELLKQLLPSIEVFTTRVDTIYGVTGLVLAPEHPLVQEITTAQQKNDVEKYLTEIKSKTDVMRQQNWEKEKSAVFTGSYAKHPLTNEDIPVWIADYVLMSYGTGAVMSVPAHDERDNQFAKQYNLPIKTVIEPVFVDTSAAGHVRSELPFAERDGIVAIVKHWSGDKYIGLKWKEVAWGTWITGGIESGQTAEQAARAEILEEVGYKNLKLVKDIGKLHSKFYHVPKKENRLLHGDCLYFELVDDEKADVSDDEGKKHEPVWLSKNEVLKFMTADAHKWAWNKLENEDYVYGGPGILVNSAEFSGQETDIAVKGITNKLVELGKGEAATTYRLRDWLVSRQRYWGAPIPIVYDPEGRPHAVNEEHLPLLLPEDVDFLPGGESPIARSSEYVNRAEKLYGKGWHFDTDTLDTFVDSSWYFLRYLSPTDDGQAFDKNLVKKWLPVDLYIGGIEHATLHLLYARFITRFLSKYGYIDKSVTEPFKVLFNIGSINLHGAKMSKSKGNVVSPDLLIEHYGTDALRGYELFIGPMDVEAEWNNHGINGIHRFILKVYKAYTGYKEPTAADSKIEDQFSIYLNKVDSMVADYKLNTAISEGMKFINTLESGKASKEVMEKFLVTLSPIFPFVAEELWEKLGHKESIFKASWPEAGAISVKPPVNIMINQKFIVSMDIESTDPSEMEKAAKTNPEIAKRLAGAELARVITVPGKMVNFITKG